MTVILLLSATQSLMAQEAFYIYRNDGDFNGFFYDQVKRMNLSKVDFDGVEHDDYVIQEVLTDDSLYRIPLLAIDSISFVQPDIIFASNFYDLSREDCPYKNAADGNMACRVDGMTEDGNYILKWRMRWWNIVFLLSFLHVDELTRLGVLVPHKAFVCSPSICLFMVCDI